MNLREAAKQKLTRVRLPTWTHGECIELHYTAEGYWTPWVTLHDPSSAHPIKLLGLYIGENNFEPV